MHADPAAPVLPILPDPADPRLTRRVTGTDQGGAATEIAVVEERPLTIYLNAQEIVTAMTIGDYPDYLALGFLRNQGMLRPDDVVTGVEYDDEIETVVVRTERRTSYEEKVKKKTRTRGCAVGTVFGDMMEGLEGLTAAAGRGADKLALRAGAPDQHHALALPRGRGDPWHGAVRARPAAGLHGGCRAPQRGRQDRRLHVPPRRRRGRQDPLHHRAADLGNGDQDAR